MKGIFAIAVLVAFVICGAVSTVGAGAGDEAKVKAMVEKALEYIKINGKDKAIAEFNNPKGQFVNGSTYVVLQSMDGVVLANGGNPKLVGQNHMEVKDPNGKLFVREFVEVAKKGGGWVNFTWVNPLTKKIQPKRQFVRKVEGADLMVQCGYFE
jgi:signal transduction histidine kinase